MTVPTRRAIVPNGLSVDAAGRGRVDDVAVIVRISYTSDVGSGLRNHIVPILQALGLWHTATGRFESAGVDRVRAANHLAQVLRAVADPQQFPEVHAQAVLKHLWVYIDRAEAPETNATGAE